MPYLLWKCGFWINFFAKRFTILLLYVCQVFINLQDHLHFFLYFVSSFMGQLFMDDPISGWVTSDKCVSMQILPSLWIEVPPRKTWKPSPFSSPLFLAMQIILDSLIHNGVMIAVGDFLYAASREPNLEPHIVHVERIWKDATGEPFIWASFYYRCGCFGGIDS